MKAAFRLILLLFAFVLAGTHHGNGVEPLFRLSNQSHQLSSAGIHVPAPVVTLSIARETGGQCPTRPRSTEDSQAAEEEEDNNNDTRKNLEFPYCFSRYLQSEHDFHDVAATNRQLLLSQFFVYPSSFNRHILLGVIRI